VVVTTHMLWLAKEYGACSEELDSVLAGDDIGSLSEEAMCWIDDHMPRDMVRSASSLVTDSGGELLFSVSIRLLARDGDGAGYCYGNDYSDGSGDGDSYSYDYGAGFGHGYSYGYGYVSGDGAGYCYGNCDGSGDGDSYSYDDDDGE
jgi:hypothetical protein